LFPVHAGSQRDAKSLACSLVITILNYPPDLCISQPTTALFI
jgi:hypothetical protein